MFRNHLKNGSAGNNLMRLKRSLKSYQPMKLLGFYKVFRAFFFPSCSHDISLSKMSSEDVSGKFFNSSDLVTGLVLSHQVLVLPSFPLLPGKEDIDVE